MDKWLWESLEQGQPTDLKFEKLMPYSLMKLSIILNLRLLGIYGVILFPYQALRRLKDKEFRPNFVVDVDLPREFGLMLLTEFILKLDSF
ncbi:MAG UNVERIFIED_CONTAM: hypothetical protein LVR29_08320 [Microcystis novacekii LVE1205-3]|jgi:hypothetical protein